MSCKICGSFFSVSNLRRACGGLIAVTFLNGAVSCFERCQIEVLDWHYACYRQIRDEDLTDETHQDATRAVRTSVIVAAVTTTTTTTTTPPPVSGRV
ncbi:MAG TPA: hypothetical protein VG055_01805 [Planctomycetaceae bacterium]|jgi:hypothetical protein|nr:hypothetical protein [Planctomycetaceae bacterium]